MVEMRQTVPQYLSDIMYDPQTSGGLLISVPADKADRLLEDMHRKGVTDAAIIGEITDSPKGKIIVK
jgi:selenide,water dikinase